MAFDFLIPELETQTGIVGNIGLYSYGTAFFAFITLVIFISISRRHNPVGNALLTASILTAAWAASRRYINLAGQPHFPDDTSGRGGS